MHACVALPFEAALLRRPLLFILYGTYGFILIVLSDLKARNYAKTLQPGCNRKEMAEDVAKQKDARAKFKDFKKAFL